MPSSWVQHVKQVQTENQCTYKEAMSLASKTWKKGDAGAKQAGVIETDIKIKGPRKTKYSVDEHLYGYAKAN